MRRSGVIGCNRSRRTALLGGVAASVGAVLGMSGAVAQSRPAERKGTPARKVPPQIIVGRGVEGLPPAVADMRAAIVAAVEAADWAELKAVMDLNELPPEVGAPQGVGPIEHLRGLSTNGSGRDVLGEIGRVLEGPWAAIPGGRDAENNRIYVWPKFAEVGVEGLSTADEAALTSLAGAEAAAAMRREKRYRGWRLSIGADGVWHLLTRVGD